MKSSFIIFGGYDGSWTDDTKRIAAFDTTSKQWKRLGQLNQARRGHGVIDHQGQFIVVGGETTGSLKNSAFSTERCIWKNDYIKCKTVDPELEEYISYPEMMSVPENFCSE